MKYDFSKLDKDTIVKLLTSDTLEQMVEILKAHNIPLPVEKVKELFDKMQETPNKELTPEDLDKVSGGYWDSYEGREIPWYEDAFGFFYKWML